MSDWEFLFEMQDEGYSPEEIMDAASCGEAPSEAYHIEETRREQPTQQRITELMAVAKNYNDFHSMLVSEYGMPIGSQLYRENKKRFKALNQ